MPQNAIQGRLAVLFQKQTEEVDTDNVEPLVSVNESAIQLREDEVTSGQCSKEVLANAPMKEYGYFAVPKVVE